MDATAAQIIEDFVTGSRQRGTRDALEKLKAKLAGAQAPVWLSCVTEMQRIAPGDPVRQLLAAALARWPQSEDLRLAAAEILWKEGAAESAESILREVLGKNPAATPATLLLARICQGQGRLDKASSLMASVCRAPDTAIADLIKGIQFIQQCQRHRLAAEICAEAIAHGRHDPGLFALSGNICRELGEFETARKHYHASLAAGVDLNAWFVPGSLALTQRFESSADPDFVLLDQQMGNPSLSVRARAATAFGLAKACDDIGDIVRAASTFRAANAGARTLQTWSTPDWNAWIDARVKAKPIHVLAPRTDFQPIFVVGLPRTGTTLASVQLAKFAGVRDRGELPLLGFLAQKLLEGGHWRDAAAMQEAADLYRLHARQDDAPARFYLDQNPLNFRYLDVIVALFPNARIIHCRRNRRDTALSIYTQFFANAEYGFAYDFAEIAAFASGHDRLMQHWRELSTGAIHELDYEALVTEPERTMAALCAFVGIDSQVDTSGEHQAITSASMWQARQPIHRSSIDRWRRYRDYMPELESMFS